MTEDVAKPASGTITVTTENGQGSVVSSPDLIKLDLAAEQTFWEKRRDDALTALNERLRTMSFGILALIWGMFIGEHQLSFQTHPHIRTALLAVTFLTVVVLALDFLEYASNYQAGRQRVGTLTGEQIKPHWDYEGARKRILLCKQVLGFATVLVFLLVLARMLWSDPPKVVKAGGLDDALAEYYGRWCIGNPNIGQSTILIIGRYQGKSHIQLNQNVCTNLQLQTRFIKFTCGDSQVAAARAGAGLIVTRWTGAYDRRDQETRTFYDCHH